MGSPRTLYCVHSRTSKRTERQYAHTFPVKSRLQVAYWPLLSGRQSWFLSRSSILAHTFIPRLRKVATTQQDPRALWASGRLFKQRLLPQLSNLYLGLRLPVCASCSSAQWTVLCSVCCGGCTVKQIHNRAFVLLCSFTVQGKK